jgi:RNA polymerase sigma-70 factor (ECF subfamily)
MTDEQAMWRVQMHRDTQAFAELVRRWEEPIRRLGVRVLGDVHRAEDVAQEAFARVFAHRRDFDPAARFSTWLWRIAVNLCRDELRRRERRGERQLPEECAGDPTQEWVADTPSPAELAVQVERAEAVRRALLRLSEPYRVVVALRHYEGLRFHEVAEVLGIPVGTVKSRMAEALDRLEVMLRPWA